MILKQVVEALVFASQKPVMPKEIVSVLKSAAQGSEDEEVRAVAGTKEAEVAAVLQELQGDYEQMKRAFRLTEQVKGWALVNAPEFGRWVRHLYPEAKPARLSGPALETLAIVAYRQPITKADIEAVRGVAVDGVVQALLERGLVRIGGRAEVPGRPLLYETTELFLEHFGLRSLDELPNTSELRRMELPTAKKEETQEKQLSFGDGKEGERAEGGAEEKPTEDESH